MRANRCFAMLLLAVPFVTACTLGGERAGMLPSQSTSVPGAIAPLPAVASRAGQAYVYTNSLLAAPHMQVPRAAHTATLLADGQVLITGGFRTEGTHELAIADAELYDPTTDTFQRISSMTAPRSGHTATLLANGEVLLVGGWGVNQRIVSAELYDPRTQTFRATASLMAPRASMTATRLADDRVIIIGGESARNTPQLVTEIYDPATSTFVASASLTSGRSAHTTTLLQNNTVLVAGGSAGNDHVLASAEIFDPRTATFTPTGSMGAVRYKHAAVLLSSGDVLLIGGSNQDDWTGKYTSTEQYSPATGTFRQTTPLAGERFKLPDGVALLRDGTVLVGSGNVLVERYNTANQRFMPSTRLDTTYYYTVLTLLQDGRVLLTGGYDDAIQPTSKAWMFS